METFTLSGQIKTLLKALKITQTGLASKIGLSQGVISEFTSGTREPSKEFLLGLPKIGISLDWFLSGEGEMFLSKTSQEKALEKRQEGYKIPILNQMVSCGRGADWVDEQNIRGYIDIFSIVPPHRPGRLFALPVSGYSMAGAGINQGDYVLFCDELYKRLIDDIYVFSLDGEVFCKYLEFNKEKDKVRIYSIREADPKKMELFETVNASPDDDNERLHIYGRVFSWVHPNLGVDARPFLEFIKGTTKDLK